MRINEAFPSKYLKASDIPDGQFVPVQIDRVDVENVGNDDDPENHKPVLYFVGKAKGMVLNRTNSSTIASAYGDETDDWRGKNLLLYATETPFQGKNVPCLRVKISKGAPAAKQPTPAAVPQQQFTSEGIAPEDIPF